MSILAEKEVEKTLENQLEALRHKMRSILYANLASSGSFMVKLRWPWPFWVSKDKYLETIKSVSLGGISAQFLGGLKLFSQKLNCSPREN